MSIYIYQGLLNYTHKFDELYVMYNINKIKIERSVYNMLQKSGVGKGKNMHLHTLSFEGY